MGKITILHSDLESFNLSKSGFCALVEVYGKKILFDTSISNDFLTNAEKAGIDLTDISHIVLSHGHYDHTNGLTFLTNTNAEIVAHPVCFEAKTHSGRKIGAPFTLAEAKEKFNLNLTEEPYFITPEIVFLGEIPRTNSFEGKTPCGENDSGPDLVLDDSALAIKSADGLVIISGCSHSGICNIIEHAKQVTGTSKVHLVLGGFHLFRQGEQLAKTIEYFKNLNVSKIYVGHCTTGEALEEFYKIGGEKFKTLQVIEFSEEI